MKSILLIVVLMMGFYSFSQDKKQNTGIVKIETNAVCSMCKKRIEHDMKYEKGVETVSLDLKTKVLTVKYDKDKTTTTTLREAVSDIGYDADSIKANPKKQKRLPSCCKPGGTCEHD